MIEVIIVVLVSVLGAFAYAVATTKKETNKTVPETIIAIEALKEFGAGVICFDMMKLSEKYECKENIEVIKSNLDIIVNKVIEKEKGEVDAKRLNDLRKVFDSILKND